MKQLTTLTVFAIGLLFLNACSGSPSAPPEPEPPASDLSCGNPALGAAAAEPFDRVEVTGISGIGDESFVTYRTASGASGITAVLVNDAGKAEIIVPPNPDDLLGGGQVQLSVTDGVTSCAELSIQVEPLPAATGDPLTDVVTAIDRLTEALATQFGLDPASVAQTSMNNLPPQAIPIALLLEALEHFDPATELDGMSPDEASFTQALFAKLDVAGVLNDIADSATGLATTAPDLRPDQRGGEIARANKTCSDLGSVPPGLFGSLQPQELSDYIKAARGANDSIGPLSSAIGEVGAAFAVMGLAAPPVGAIAGWVAFTATLVQKMRANLYPSSISRVEFQLDTTEIEEDWDTERGDPEIKWSFAKIWATNNGMGLARVGLDFITTAAALPTGVAGAVADVATGALDIAVKEQLNALFDQMEQDPDAGEECWGVGATEFGPIVVPDDSGDQWVRAEIISGSAISVDGADIRKIQPEQVGTATLRVRTQEDPFPGPFGFGDKQVEVLRKEVVWIPSELLVENPGETRTIKFRIDNSRHNGPEDVEIIPGPNLGNLPQPTFSGGVHTIELTTPSERDDYPTHITAKSTSKSLPPATPERSARIDIFSDEGVKISPRDGCVGSGESETLTATVTGPDELTVRWEIVSGPGTLSSTSGEEVDYSAPSSGSGTVTIRAYLDQDTEVEDTVTFRYGACTGLAVYYGVTAEIGFPFLPGGDCNNPDIDEEYEEITFTEDAAEPWASPAPSALWIDRSETVSNTVLNAGLFGKEPPGSDACTTAFFSAEAGYEATFTGSADGTRLDLDITAEAASNCEDMGELGPRCASATTAVSFAARFDFDITQATDYRLQLDWDCTSVSLPGLPPVGDAVTIITVRIDPSGNVLPVNQTTQPITAACGSGNPNLNIDQVMEFAAPANAGQTDHVMVLVQAQSLSFGAMQPGDSGPVRNTGSLKGFVMVEEVD